MLVNRELGIGYPIRNNIACLVPTEALQLNEEPETPEKQ
jgi:uncharacterized protein YbaR (Trm112 family)